MDNSKIEKFKDLEELWSLDTGVRSTYTYSDEVEALIECKDIKSLKRRITEDINISMKEFSDRLIRTSHHYPIIGEYIMPANKEYKKFEAITSMCIVGLALMLVVKNDNPEHISLYVRALTTTSMMVMSLRAIIVFNIWYGYSKILDNLRVMFYIIGMKRLEADYKKAMDIKNVVEKGFEPEVDIIEEHKKNEVESYSETVEEFIKIIDKSKKNLPSEMKGIADGCGVKVLKLYKKLQSKPDRVRYASSLFKVYIEEIQELIQQYESMNNENKIALRDTLIHFSNYLDKTIKKVSEEEQVENKVKMETLNSIFQEGEVEDGEMD